MSYQLEQGKQTYGNQEYLVHKITGESSTDDRYLFGQRVPSVGIIKYVDFQNTSTKTFDLTANNFTSPIQLVSVYAVRSNGNLGEITIEVMNGAVTTVNLTIKAEKMPLGFPDGLIIYPFLSLKVTPKNSDTNVLLYWRPVHVISDLNAA